MEVRVNEEIILDFEYNIHRGGYYNGSISDIKLKTVILCLGGLEIDITDRLTPLELSVLENDYADHVVAQYGENCSQGEI